MHGYARVADEDASSLPAARAFSPRRLSSVTFWPRTTRVRGSDTAPGRFRSTLTSPGNSRKMRRCWVEIRTCRRTAAAVAKTAFSHKQAMINKSTEGNCNQGVTNPTESSSFATKRFTFSRQVQKVHSPSHSKRNV